jgi:transcriptional regulator with XRE-family HTH domain
MMTHPLEKWRLKEQARRGKPYPRSKLAEELDVWPSRLTQIINDGETPSAELLRRIRGLTGISADKILDASVPVGER